MAPGTLLLRMVVFLFGLMLLGPLVIALIQTFHPSRGNIVASAIVSLLALPCLRRFAPARGARDAHGRRLRSHHRAFQWLGLAGALFMALCFGMGMAWTAAFGQTMERTVEVVGAKYARHCGGVNYLARVEETRRSFTYCSRHRLAIHAAGAKLRMTLQESPLGFY